MELLSNSLCERNDCSKEFDCTPLWIGDVIGWFDDLMSLCPGIFLQLCNVCLCVWWYCF